MELGVILISQLPRGILNDVVVSEENLPDTPS